MRMLAAVQMTGLGLARVPLLADLPRDRLEQLAARCAWTRFAQGQVIVSRDRPTTDVHLIVDGRVRIHVGVADGRDVLFTQVQEGAIVGDFAAVDGGLRVTDAHACTSVLSASVSAPAFRQLLQEEPRVEERYVRYLVGLVRTLTDRVVELSTLPVQNRIRAELLRQALAHAGAGPVARLEPPPRHADIAAQVGTTREQVTRELSALARTGVLEKDAGALVVTSVQRLQQLVKCQREPQARSHRPVAAVVTPVAEEPLAVSGKRYQLTPAELAVVCRLAMGARSKEIARERGASVHTVRAQIKSVMEKTGTHSQLALLAKLR
jgi:CRP-like cAMP-binding protein/DNA-binding CsgD family transcriptional regulator